MHNAWATVKPSLKLLYGLTVCFLSLAVPHFLFGYLIFFLVLFVLAHFAKIKPKKFLRSYKVPLIFILISLITIVFEFGTFPQNTEILWSSGEGSGIFVTREGLWHAFVLSSRVIGSLAGLFTIALTCSLPDILQAMKNLHFPDIFLSMTELIYRFSMSIYDNFQNVITAQEQRLAYFNPLRGIPALGQALARVFSKLLNKSKTTSAALDLRLFKGRLNTLPISYPEQPEKEREIFFNWLFLLLLAICFTMLAWRKR